MRRVASPDNRYTSCIGIDDGPFLSRRLGGSKAPLLAVKLDGPRLTQVRAGWITVDGMDATGVALKLLARFNRIECPVLLAGVTFGGFNMVDPRKLQKTFRTPIIVVIGTRPDNRAVKRALMKHFPDWKKRWAVIRALGPLRNIRTVLRDNPIDFEECGCSIPTARRILSAGALVSRFPEPLRVAGLVARGLFSSQLLDSGQGYSRL